MAKKCEICGKGVIYGHQISHSNIKTKKTWKANLQKVRIKNNGKKQKTLVCTRCIRSGKINKTPAV